MIDLVRFMTQRNALAPGKLPGPVQHSTRRLEASARAFKVVHRFWKS